MDITGITVFFRYMFTVEIN